MRLLLAEDERDLNHILTKRLTNDGYSVDSCFNGEEALEFLNVAEYDAVILDIMMPKVDGLEVLKRIRSAGKDTPVIFLTAKDAIEDRVLGLDSGANDYLVKPFSLEELRARLRVLLRTQRGAVKNELIVADLVLDCNTQKVTRGGKEIVLSAKEYALLEYMMHNAGVILSREKIENHIWNFDYEGGTNVVDVYISYLRKKIDEGQEKKLIHTVRGRGYVLQEDI
ncbi:response regulator transcription factor [Acetivibrio ethanolgignens]|uniref:Stage 0 sporulation protein A homolog n=1 Tax=Acetivibrio ethanolgignens TaxID=290052 RepID=A0A0V8QFA5_9FIRM|nr:response regulator transcription factor [Acetivibrio ethanolgignens]KSV59288.1 two-component system response regulator [Acetivibrio ethanolgignens]